MPISTERPSSTAPTTSSSARPRAARLAIALAAALASGASVATVAAPASAQYQPQYAGRFEPGEYTGWRPAWDRDRYDRRHVVLGTVGSFAPYRLGVRHPDGFVQTIDLKNGTIILPTGGTPQVNQHVAVIGYWSNGTFIANRVILRS